MQGNWPDEKRRLYDSCISNFFYHCYIKQVFIEQARQLKSPDGPTVDPMIEAEVMNVKKYTTAKDDIGSSGICTWNEHLFFEPRNVVCYFSFAIY